MSANIRRVVVMRVLVRVGFSRIMDEIMLKDVKHSVDHRHKHGPTVPQTASHAKTFTPSAIAAEAR